MIAAARTVEPHRTLWAGVGEVRSVRDLSDLPITERPHLQDTPVEARLSAQEERILGEVAGGKTNREIGADLKLAEKTVKNYVSSILSKLEVARRAEAAAYLARHTQRAG